MPRFHNERAAARKQPRGLRNQRAIGVKSVRAAVQRAMRIVIAHLYGETSDFRRADIGWVRHNQIEFTRQRRRIVAGDERRARRKPRASINNTVYALGSD